MREDISKERFIFFGHLIFLGVALLLQTWNIFDGRVKPDFVLVMLLVSSMFLKFPKLFLMILISVFFLNFRPGFSPEFAVITLLAILAFLAAKMIPGRMELIGFLAVLLGTLIFYSISAFSSFWANLVLVLEIVIGNLAFGATLYFMVSRYLNPSK